MSKDRMARVNELLRREIGEVLYQVLGSSDLDLSAVTIVDVSASRDLRRAHVRVSVRDHEADKGKTLKTLRSRRAMIQKRINRDLVLKYTPRLSFELDKTVEKGDHILDVLDKMEHSSEPAPDLIDESGVDSMSVEDIPAGNENDQEQDGQKTPE